MKPIILSLAKNDLKEIQHYCEQKELKSQRHSTRAFRGGNIMKSTVSGVLTLALSLLLILTLAACDGNGDGGNNTTLPVDSTPDDDAPSPDNNGSGSDITHETPEISDSYGNTNGNNSNGALAEQDGDAVHNGESSIQTPIFAEYITQGYEIEAALGVIALVHPDLGWDEADSEGFTARFDEDGRLIIATDDFNVFREVEGMTSAEINVLITTIRQEASME